MSWEALGSVFSAFVRFVIGVRYFHRSEDNVAPSIRDMLQMLVGLAAIILVVTGLVAVFMKAASFFK